MSPFALFLLLAVLQGLTEYFPVSSSGHLTLARNLVPGGERLPNDATIEVVLHFGTLLSVLVFYRHTLLRLMRGVLGVGAAAEVAGQRRLATLIVIGSIPVVVVALSLQSWIEVLFDHPELASTALLLNGMMLLASGRIQEGERGLRDLTLNDAIVIGGAQAVALVPGFSRSGYTIVAGLWRGLRPGRAAAFSFLLAIPALTGATILKLPQALQSSEDKLPLMQLGAGVLVSFIVGYVALAMLVWLARLHRMLWFAPYCWIVGAVGLYFSFSR